MSVDNSIFLLMYLCALAALTLAVFLFARDDE